MPPTQSMDDVMDNELYVRGPADWEQILTGDALHRLENTLLPEFLPRQRWFGGKSHHIASTKLIDWGAFEDGRSVLALLDVRYEGGASDIYLVPLGTSFGDEAVELREKSPRAIIATVISPQGSGVLRDGLRSDETLLALLSLIADAGKVDMQHGIVEGIPSRVFPFLRGNGNDMRPRISPAEQSNSSIFYGQRLMLKLFRRQQPGINPDTEIGRYLTEQTSFRSIAPFGGSIDYRPIDYRTKADIYTLAMLQGLVVNENDGWQWTLDKLEEYYASCTNQVFPSNEAASFPADFDSLSKVFLPERIRDCVRSYLDAAKIIGRRTGELHFALGSVTTEADFAPRPFTAADLTALREQLSANATRAFEALEGNLTGLPDDTLASAKVALSRRERIFARLNKLTTGQPGGLLTRVHGDYHLGQLLRTKSDFVILDFEGEPARSLAERRAKQSPLKDVAGMLRSFSYAAFAALTHHTETRPEDAAKLEPWAAPWEQAVTAEFLKAYRKAVDGSSILPSVATEFDSLLKAFVLDKALYELIYELNNRPTWVRIPLNGILSLTR